MTRAKVTIAEAYHQRTASTLKVLEMLRYLEFFVTIINAPSHRVLCGKVSGFSETERVTKAQALGAWAYVKKPYMSEKLELAVKKEFDRSTLLILEKRRN